MKGQSGFLLSSLSMTGRSFAVNEGIETHHEIRASWWKEIPHVPREAWLPSHRVGCPQLLCVSSECPPGCISKNPTVLATWAAAPQSQDLGWPVSYGLFLWLSRDSLHTPTCFLPQRAGGTDPEQALEGRGVSQALRAMWGEMESCGFCGQC